MTPAPLTAVIISYRKNRRNHRILFGEPAIEIRRGWRRKIIAFPPDTIFAYERWCGDAFGTQDWRLFVCRTTSPGAVTRIPGVLPGAELLLFAKGKTRVMRALNVFSDMEKTGCTLNEIAPWRWRTLHNDLEIGMQL